ncbi:MAG: hypothetical protein JSR20_06035 [Nitrospira sp.]|nr:hypothetical protein [Nitrospira sp.]
MSRIWIGTGLLLALLSACAEGRWVQAERTDAQMQEDWEQCKTEVLAGEEHRKETMAGGINLSGCMQSKGYRYVEAHKPKAETAPATRD